MAEPGIYGVALPEKKPFIISCIGYSGQYHSKQKRDKRHKKQFQEVRQYFFHPIFTGATAARKFQINQFTGMIIGACFVYPFRFGVVERPYTVLPHKDPHAARIPVFLSERPLHRIR